MVAARILKGKMVATQNVDLEKSFDFREMLYLGVVMTRFSLSLYSNVIDQDL